MHLLPTNLASLADVCGDGTRFAMHGVHVRVHGDGTYLAEATDSRVILRVTGPTTGPVDDYPTFPALLAAPNGESEGIIPAKSWASHFKAAKKMTNRFSCSEKPILQSVPIVFSKDTVTMGATNLEATAVETAMLIDGKWPAVSDIFPSVRPTTTLTIGCKLLMQLLKSIAPFCGNGPQKIRIELHANNHGKVDRPVVIHVVEPESAGQVVSAIIMPMISD